MVCLVGVQGGERGADRDGLPGADLAGDDPDAVFGDAPADPGDGLAVGGVAVQHPRGEVAPERGAGEPEEPLQAVDHDLTPLSVASLSVASLSVASLPVSRSSWPGSSLTVLVRAA